MMARSTAPDGAADDVLRVFWARRVSGGPLLVFVELRSPLVVSPLSRYPLTSPLD